MNNQEITTWNQCFDGLSDADGSLLISTKGYASLEITTQLSDKQVKRTEL